MYIFNNFLHDIVIVILAVIIIIILFSEFIFAKDGITIVHNKQSITLHNT